MPPSGARCSCTSSMKLRMRKMPRPLDFSRFSGVERIGQRLGIEAFALIADAIDELGHVAGGDGLELDEHVLARRRCGCRA